VQQLAQGVAEGALRSRSGGPLESMHLGDELRTISRASSCGVELELGGLARHLLAGFSSAWARPPPEGAGAAGDEAASRHELTLFGSPDPPDHIVGTTSVPPEAGNPSHSPRRHDWLKSAAAPPPCSGSWRRRDQTASAYGCST
jgi:hypothetical protein